MAEQMIPWRQLSAAEQAILEGARSQASAARAMQRIMVDEAWSIIGEIERDMRAAMQLARPMQPTKIVKRKGIFARIASMIKGR